MYSESTMISPRETAPSLLNKIGDTIECPINASRQDLMIPTLAQRESVAVCPRSLRLR